MNTMESIPAVLIERNEEQSAGKEVENAQMPFICGYCQRQFDRISPYCVHIREHSEATDNTFHICDGFDGSRDRIYKCKKCQLEFPSVCLLHSHLVFCIGSYVFDNEHSTAFPVEDLSMFINGRNEGTHEVEKETSLSELGGNKGSVNGDIGDVPHNDNVIITDTQLDDIPNNLNELRSKEAYTQTDTGWLTGDLDNATGSSLTQDQTVSLKTKSKKNRKNIKANVKVTKHLSKTSAEKSKKENTKKYGNSQPSSPKNGRVVKRKMPTRYTSSKRKRTCSPKQKRAVKGEELPVMESKLTMSEHESDIAAESDENTEYENASFNDILAYELESGASENRTTCNKRMKRSYKKRKTSIRSKEKSTPSTCKEKQKYECEVCGKPQRDSRRLQHHMISHSDARNFVCEICSVSYKYPNHLKVHMKSHNAVKPFYCELCGEGFIELQRLKAHKIHKHTTDRAHQCPECGLSFKFKAGLNRHLTNHATEKLHQCEVCGQQFSRKYYLVQHMWIHTNTRRFECNEDGCDRKFFTNYQLQCHLKMHTGERPYMCGACPAKFIQRKELRRHMKKTHSLILDANALDDAAAVMKEESVNNMNQVPTEHSSYIQYLPSLVIADDGPVVSDHSILPHSGFTDLVKSEPPLQAFHITDTLPQESKEFSLTSLGQ